MTDEEIVVSFALIRLDDSNRDLDLEDIAALVVRRLTPDQVLDLATRNLTARNELRGALFESAVEHVLRIVLTARGPVD
ncbi:hypothetical protein [Nocardia sp. alder85J]|uniref:hypothetical protein n=1 Tax=Nocardia sp. alder85J TaxID=2862949 RepID=UPI001CD6B841|nr:hypothetical protein [Nocardia sp. alder85J]MCX4091396.1 hypothetical protein [Nocardia sp. alder85J]